MRVTRYVNGRKTEKAQLTGKVIKNELAENTIETVNKRLFGKINSAAGKAFDINE